MYYKRNWYGGEGEGSTLQYVQEGGGIILVKRPMGGLIFGEERGMSKEK